MPKAALQPQPPRIAGSAAPPSYLDLHKAEPLARIEMIKRGVPAQFAKGLLNELALSQSAGAGALNLPVATLNRKVARDDTLGPDESERVLGLARLIGQVEDMVRSSGDAAGFDPAAWLSRWLREPLGAFGGVRPIELMDTMEGQALVSQTLAQAQSGAYA
jgi:putative toxin-antitoxin system antitoxin component (TIGR02293 family)